MLLGIDFGTSYFKVGLFDRDGRLKGLGRIAVEKDTPAPGRAELPVPRFWALLRHALGEALAQAGAEPADIAALSYSSQSNSFVLLDANNVPLTPLVLWTDARAEPLPADLIAFSRTPEFVRTVGFSGWSAGFAVANWRWFQEREPATWSRVRRALTLPEYFTFSLTGEPAGDASTAAFTGLLDLARGQWWPAALEAARVRADQLARPQRPGSVAGRTSRAAAECLGLPGGIPFGVGGLDHHVAALGSGLGVHADVSISTGTVLAAIALVPAPEPRAACYHGPHFDGRQFYRLAFDPIGAGQLEDYQRQHAPGLTIEDLLMQAAQAGERVQTIGRATNQGGLAGTGTCPPTSTGDHGVVVRQLLGKIAATQRELVRRVTTDARVSRIVATGGGARSPLWLQIQADTIGVPILTPGSPERACLGAAMIASVAAGWRRDLVEAAEAMVSAGREYVPRQAVSQ